MKDFNQQKSDEGHVAATGPRLIFPAVYVDNVSYLRRPLRVSYLLGAVHIQYRPLNQHDYETVRRALLWG